MSLFFALACAGAVILLVAAELRGSRPGRYLAKTVASAAFVATAIANGALDSEFGRVILAGLVLCAFGDVLLMFDRRSAFLAGMAAFAAGHISYAAGFLGVGVSPAPAFAALAATAALCFGSLVWLWPHLGAFRLPVVGYMAIISVMVGAATGYWGAQENGQGNGLLAASAAAAFAVSDLSVARDKFVRPGFANRVWGLPLYYAAQTAFAFIV